MVEAFGNSYVKHRLARLLFVGEERNQISKGCKGEAGSFNVTSSYPVLSSFSSRVSSS